MKLILSTGVLYTHNKLRSGVSVIDCVVECYVHHTGIETVFESQNSGWVEVHQILISLYDMQLLYNVFILDFFSHSVSIN